MEMFSLKDKAIIVTGGTGVLGEAFINGIVNAGGAVGILGRNRVIAEQRAAEINNRGGRAIALVADVLDQERLTSAREKVLEAFGRIDGLVNGAGGNKPAGVINPADDIFKLDMNGLREVMDLNLWGTMLPVQVFGEAMASGGQGSIVNISSMASQTVISKVLGYTLAKTAIDAYTRWFAVETAARYGDKLRMNALAPGFFITEQNRNLLMQPDGDFTPRGQAVIRQTPFKRFGQPDELVGALVWLLSDASKFVTGTVVNVDGGFAVNSGV